MRTRDLQLRYVTSTSTAVLSISMGADMLFKIRKHRNAHALAPYTARDCRANFGLADETNWMRLRTAAVLLALLLL